MLSATIGETEEVTYRSRSCKCVDPVVGIRATPGCGVRHGVAYPVADRLVDALLVQGQN